MENVHLFSSVYGRISASNRTAERGMRLVYICGVAFQLPWSILPKKKSKKRLLVLYPEGNQFCVAVFVSPRRATWLHLQELARDGELTVEMLQKCRPVYLSPVLRIR